MTKRALITGVTGQDGSYLAELLIAKGYEVHGIVRRSSTSNTARIAHLADELRPQENLLTLHAGDLSDGGALRRTLRQAAPHEIYNLAAQSHVGVSFEAAEYTADVVGMGTLRLLEAVRDYAQETGAAPRVYQAGSSEMFGGVAPPQRESTPFHPRSPYAIGKVAAYWHCVNHREAYGLFIANGILFNHESPRRGETFVTRKITRALARIHEGLQDRLSLGNLEAKRDWGFAGDYVEAMWRMLQAEVPDDFVIATGEAYSVRDFLDEAAGCLGIDWQRHVEIDPRYFRPTEVNHLCGNASKARTVLGWSPRVSFAALVRMMVEHDLHLARQERMLRRAGNASDALRAVAYG
jgi:GDPmannose 4,6-dehydratase